MARINPAPGKEFVRNRPTPLVGDVLFYELRDREAAPNQTPPAYGTAHPDTRQWPNHKLVFVDPADQTGWERWWYAADRDSQDNYNYKFTKDGDRDLIVRTSIRPRVSAVWATPSLGDAFTQTPSDVFSGATGYVLVERGVQPIDDERIRSMYVAEVLVYEKLPGDITFSERQEDDVNTIRIYTQRVLASNPGTGPVLPNTHSLISSRLEATENDLIKKWVVTGQVLPAELLAGFDYDSDSDSTLPFTTQVVDISELPSPTAAGDGIDEDGFVTEWKPVDQFRVQKIRRMVVPDGDKSSLTYEVGDFAYNFPNVFQSLILTPIPRRDGRTQTRVSLNIQDGGSRYCRATITEEWFAEYPGQPDLPVTFVEDGFTFQGANLQFSCPACLHPSLVLYDNVGNQDPVFEPQTYTYYVPATNYITIPPTFVARIEQSKQRGGGWKRTTVTVQTPPDLLS